MFQRPRNPRSEGQLGFDIGESLSPIEWTRRCLFSLAGYQKRCGYGQNEPQRTHIGSDTLEYSLPEVPGK